MDVIRISTAFILLTLWSGAQAEQFDFNAALVKITCSCARGAADKDKSIGYPLDRRAFLHKSSRDRGLIYGQLLDWWMIFRWALRRWPSLRSFTGVFQ
ncbi:hypothetical protein MRX96_028170 [Rhipicephalus microplus]